MLMPEHRGRVGRAPSGDDERLRAAGSLIWRERELLLATAARVRERGDRSFVECKLRGGSMATAIPARSRIRIACGLADLRVGDVAAFVQDERIVVHRVAYRRRRDRRNAVLILRGDAMVVPDPPVAVAAILGHVVEFDSGSGWRPVGVPGWKAPRDRLLGMVFLFASALMLEVGVELARRCTGWLRSIHQRPA
jgi:hypothetical protein